MVSSARVGMAATPKPIAMPKMVAKRRANIIFPIRDYALSRASIPTKRFARHDIRGASVPIDLANFGAAPLIRLVTPPEWSHDIDPDFYASRPHTCEPRGQKKKIFS